MAAHAFAHVKHVAIIGGGVAGLNTARALAARGLQCTIYEARADTGGVWRSNYSGYALQVPKNLYEFLDFPMPGSDWAFPTGAQVQAYIKDFERRHVSGKAEVRLNARVSALTPRPGGERGWEVTTTTGDRQGYDFVVAATGGYSTPSLPALDKGADYTGTLQHSTEFTSAEAVKGKHVVVLGGAKSALDCAVAAARAGAASTTLVSRAAHWGTPRKIAGLIPFQYVFLSRFGQALVSWFKGALPGAAPSSVGAVHSAIAPIMRPVFGVVEALFAFQLALRGVRAPQLDVVADFYGFASVLDTSFQEAVASGKVAVVRGEGRSLSSAGLTLAGAGGAVLPCQALICATGFSKSYDYLPPATREALAPAADGLYLYRHILPPAVADLAFIGSEVATISNVATHGLQAEWLARLLSGGHSLPPRAAMAAAVAEHARWARGWMPSTPSRASLVLLHQTHYHDALCKDMGVAHRRKGNPVSEIFMPYRPSDYGGIVGGARA